MRALKSIILIVLLMSVLLPGCRLGYHTTVNITKEVEREIPYEKFEDCLYIWEDRENLLQGYVMLSENIENKTYYYNHSDIILLEKRVNYPSVVDESHGAIKKAIEDDNERIRIILDSQVQEALDLANSNLQGLDPKASKESVKIVPYEFDHSWKAIRNDEKLLTIVRSIYSYTGGAHPNIYKEVTSFNPETGKKLDIESISSHVKNFKQYVEDALHAYVIDNNCSQYLFGENGYKDAFRNWDKNWWIKNGYLFVGFNTYDIAPYVAGPLVIPVDILNAKELLNEYGIELIN